MLVNLDDKGIGRTAIGRICRRTKPHSGVHFSSTSTQVLECRYDKRRLHRHLIILKRINCTNNRAVADLDVVNERAGVGGVRTLRQLFLQLFKVNVRQTHIVDCAVHIHQVDVVNASRSSLNIVHRIGSTLTSRVGNNLIPLRLRHNKQRACARQQRIHFVNRIQIQRLKGLVTSQFDVIDFRQVGKVEIRRNGHSRIAIGHNINRVRIFDGQRIIRCLSARPKDAEFFRGMITSGDLVVIDCGLINQRIIRLNIVGDEFIVSNVIFNSFNVLLNVVIVVVSSAFNFSKSIRS